MGTVLVLAVLAAAVALVVRYLLRRRKSGCACGSCSHCSHCSHQ